MVDVRSGLEQVLLAGATAQAEHNAAVREPVQVHRRSRGLQRATHERAGDARAELDLFRIGRHRCQVHEHVGARSIDPPSQAKACIFSQPGQAGNLVDVVKLQGNSTKGHSQSRKSEVRIQNEE